MLKRVALLISLSVIILIPILLFLPASYQITIHSSRYYAYCTDNKTDTNQCKTIDPPVLVVKQEPYVRAWWNKTQTDRQFAVHEVSTQWVDKGTFISGGQTSGVLPVLIILIELFILLGITYLFISTIINALKLKGSERIAWICLIIFVFPLGSIIFALTKSEKNKKHS